MKQYAMTRDWKTQYYKHDNCPEFIYRLNANIVKTPVCVCACINSKN